MTTPTLSWTDELYAYGLALQAGGVSALCGLLLQVWSARLAAGLSMVRARWFRMTERWFALEVRAYNSLHPMMIPARAARVRTWYTFNRIDARDQYTRHRYAQRPGFRGGMAVRAHLLAASYLLLADWPTLCRAVWFVDCLLDLVLYVGTLGLKVPALALLGTVLGLTARVVVLTVRDRAQLAAEARWWHRTLATYGRRWGAFWAARPRLLDEPTSLPIALSAMRAASAPPDLLDVQAALADLLRHGTTAHPSLN